MDSSFVIKPRAPLHKSYAARDPLPVRASIETELDTSKTVNATGGDQDGKHDQARDDGQGPFNGGPGANVWRSFLTDEYAKSFTKAGGIGIADQVHRTLLAQQEVK